MTEILCINCKQPLKFLFSAKDNISKKKYEYFRCQNCQLIRIYPFPDLKNLYHQNPYSLFIKKNPQARFLNSLPLGNFLFNKYFELTKNRLKEVLSLKKTGKLLDIGCSGGEFLKNFDRKWELHGLEINSDMAKVARINVPKAKIYTNKIEGEKLPKNYFDVITMWHVFEHLKDPQLVLRNIHTSLKVGGHIIIEVPSAESLYRKIFKKHWQLLIVPEHLYFYSKKSLCLILVNNGFRITKVNHFSTFSPSAISSLANFLRSRGINSNIAIISGITLFPIILLINLFSFSARENLMVIAKKHK